MSLKFQEELLRGAVFKAAYVQTHAKALPVLGAAPDWASDVTDAGMPAEKRTLHVGLRQLGNCILDAQPAAVHALLLADAGTAAEQEAFRELTPSIGPCIPDGVTLSFSRSVLAGLLAEVAKRRADNG
ncbi:hypothetical protein [Polymorphobacter multimanifer]|uniref:Uncharacterized protein n=1 Tax=Polymorphobacter multimanifer TaxID=1070431 RepID=A0A841L3M5_9SPHN|nr:hypothetical protein [Polymorphobacter multimanifer]MBB6227439.1 hypothetical protein [Polymorphobacter multimanifer]